MVEYTRAHERIAERSLAGVTRSFEGPLAKPVSVFVPASARKAKTVRVVIHFHGSAFLPHYAVSQLRGDYAVAVVQLGSGSGIYDRNFSDRTYFESLLVDVQHTVEEAVGHRRDHEPAAVRRARGFPPAPVLHLETRAFRERHDPTFHLVSSREVRGPVHERRHQRAVLVVVGVSVVSFFLTFLTGDPAEIMLIVAGGPGTHSVYVPCFGNSRAITRRIEL